MGRGVNSKHRLRIALAASGGGHLRQLLDLEQVWEHHDSVFVTERSVLGESIAQKWPAHFVQHYAFGQAKLGKPFRMIGGMIVNFVQSFVLALRLRPQFIITTGAAAVFWFCLIARFMGARLVVIESFARFEGPSVFGHLIHRFASDLVVQSEPLTAMWPDAHFFDPFQRITGERPKKEALVFATVGATLPFDRFVEAVLELRRDGRIPENLVLQVGRGSECALPGTDDTLECVETLEFDALKQILERADIVLAHGGTGSIITALRQGCRVVAMPRLFAKGEVYDDHQIEIVTAFSERGLIEYARDESDLAGALQRAREKEPIMATTDPAALRDWLAEALACSGGKRDDLDVRQHLS